MATKTKVILAQLGSPKSPSVKDVRAFLREFLGDPRVVDAPRWLWFIVLNFFVLPFRPRKSAEAYGRIWDGTGFPLVKTTMRVAQALKPHMAKNIELHHAFLVCEPRPGKILNDWREQDPFKRAEEVLVLPQFPQYAESTVASVIDSLGKEFQGQVNLPGVKVVNSYHRSKAFIDGSVRQIRDSLQAHPADVLVISFHGIPLRRVLEKKDIYFQHCLETFKLIQRELGTIPCEMKMTFQSRFGSEVWLGPYTDATVLELVKQGKKRISVYCPSFVVDCLETTDEIGNELGHAVKQIGGKLTAVACLNDDPQWIKEYAHFINTTVNGAAHERAELSYEIDVREEYMV